MEANTGIIRGMTGWDMEPTTWIIELSETYQSLVQLPLEFFQRLDQKIVDASDAIAVYYQNKSAGVAIQDEDLRSLRDRINVAKSETTNSTLVQNQEKAKAVYEKLHPQTNDLPFDMQRLIFNCMDYKCFILLSETTSKGLQRKIFKDPFLGKPLFLYKAQDALNQAEESRDKSWAQFRLVRIFAGDGNIPSAQNIANTISKEIENPNPYVCALSEIALAKAKNKDMDGASDTFGLALKRPLNWRDYRDNVVVPAIKCGFIDWAKKQAQAEKNTDAGQANYILREIGEWYFEKGEFAHARITAEEANDDYVSNSILQKIFNFEIEAGLVDEARETFQKITSFKFDNSRLLINALFQRGDVAEVKKIIESGKEQIDKWKLHLEFAKLQFQYGDVKGSKITFEDTITRAKDLTVEKGLNTVLAHAGHVLAECGFVQRAFEMTELLDMYYNFDLFKKIVKMCALGGDPLKGKQFGKIYLEGKPWRKDDFKTETDAIIGKALAENGDFEGADEIADGMTSIKEKFYLKYLTSIAQAKRGDYENAKRRIKKFHLDHGSKALATYISTLSEIAIEQDKSGDREGAKATFSEALKETVALENSYSKVKLQTIVIIAQIKTGDTQGALKNYWEYLDKVVDVLNTPNPQVKNIKSESQVNIVKEFTIKDDTYAANAVAKKIQDLNKRSEAFTSITEKIYPPFKRLAIPELIGPLDYN